jgi:hypothetical protein
VLIAADCGTLFYIQKKSGTRKTISLKLKFQGYTSTVWGCAEIEIKQIKT